MNSLSWIITVSLVVNVALATLILRTRAGTPDPVRPDTVVSQTTSPEPEATIIPVMSPAEDTGASDTVTPVAVVSWTDLETEDLKEFIRRLRVAGCPEETIQDIILAEVSRRYSPREQELLKSIVGGEYWQVRPRGKEASARDREIWKTREALTREKSELLVDLLGVDPAKQRREEEGLSDHKDFARGNISFLPESKKAAVKQYLDEFHDKMQDFYARMAGGWDAEARAEQKKLEAEKLQGLAHLLTPQELREFELRNSQMATQVASELKGVSLTRAQYETLYDIRKRYGDSIYNYGDANNDAAAREQIEQNKRDLDAEIALALGEAKGRELERAKDYHYQQLSSLARRAKLPPDTAARVYDYKQAAEDTAKLLRSNDELSSEERQIALQQIRAETENVVKTSLGDKTFKRYMRQSGWWLKNLAPDPSRTSQ